MFDPSPSSGDHVFFPLVSPNQIEKQTDGSPARPLLASWLVSGSLFVMTYLESLEDFVRSAEEMYNANPEKVMEIVSMLGWMGR